MEIKVPDIILSTLNLELTLKHIKDLCTFFCQIWICIENLYPKLPSAPSISQESFNIDTVRKYYRDITDLKNKYNEKQRKYKNAYNRLLHVSTGVSSAAVVSDLSTIGTSVTVVGLPISASLAVVNTVSTCVSGILLLSSEKYKKNY